MRAAAPPASAHNCRSLSSVRGLVFPPSRREHSGRHWKIGSVILTLVCHCQSFVTVTTVPLWNLDVEPSYVEKLRNVQVHIS